MITPDEAVLLKPGQWVYHHSDAFSVACPIGVVECYANEVLHIRALDDPNRRYEIVPCFYPGGPGCSWQTKISNNAIKYLDKILAAP